MFVRLWLDQRPALLKSLPYICPPPPWHRITGHSPLGIQITQTKSGLKDKIYIKQQRDMNILKFYAFFKKKECHKAIASTLKTVDFIKLSLDIWHKINDTRKKTVLTLMTGDQKNL